MAMTEDDRKLLLPRKMEHIGGRNLDGGVWIDCAVLKRVDCKKLGQKHTPERVDLHPEVAFHLAAGILRSLGVKVDFDYNGPGS